MNLLSKEPTTTNGILNHGAVKPNADSRGFCSKATDPFAEIIDFLPVGAFVLRNDSILIANTAFLNCLGYTQRSEMQGMSFSDLLYKGDRPGYLQSLHNPYHTPSESYQSYRIYTKDGRILWVRIHFAPVPGKISSLRFGCLDECADLKKAQEKLQDMLQKYQTIFDDVEDVLAEVDLNGNILSVNNNANVKIWGISREQTIGTNYRRYVDRHNERIVRQAYRRIYETGRAGKVTYEIRRIDGQRRFVEDSASLMYDAGGTPTGFRVVSRDVTDRKETEKKLEEHQTYLEAIFSSVEDAIITVDREMRVIHANKSTQDICGVSASGMAGRHFSRCLGRCNHSCCDVIRMTLEKKKTVKDYRLNCGYAGRQQTVNITSSPLLSAEGVFLGAVLVIRDITLLKNMENELRERNPFQNIVGQSRKMRSIYSLIENLADMDTTVLITGESGTGKELVARALHYSGRRACHPFVAVNCCALTESLLESELFGHVKGAFTGAIREREGRFQAANGGTILLDEIGELSPMIQLKLLRVLQEKVYERVGESEERKADIRIITCTNRDLKEKVRRGELREDLYYRLKVVEIPLPALRERREDIPLLIEHFRKMFNKKFDKQVDKIDPDVIASFMEYVWPGNVRELEHIMEHAFVLCRKTDITMDDLPLEFKESLRPSGVSVALSCPNDAQAVQNALMQAGGNKARAAKLLGVSRQTIYRKIYQYQLGART